MTNPSGGADPNLAGLSAAAKDAVQAKSINGAWSVASLVELLTELEQWDLKIEENRKRMKKFFIGSLAASMIGFILFIIVAASIGLFSIAPSLFAIPVISAFTFKRKLNEVKRRDVPNELRLVIRPMLKQLRHDLHPQAWIKTTISLTPVDELRGTKSTLPLIGTDKSRELTVFQQEVCDVRMPLADGSIAVLRLNNTFHKVDRRYKAISGKTKSKTKWKKLSTATVMMIPTQSVEWEPGQVQRYMDDTCEKLSFSDSNGISVPRLDRHYKFKKEQEPPEDSIPAEDVVALFIRIVAMQPIAAGGTT